MEKLKKMKIVILEAIVVVMLVCGLVGCNKTDVGVNDSIPKEPISENKEEVWVSRSIKEISGDYTLDEAVLDKAFIIGKDNFPQNKTALNLFTDNLGANKATTLRVVMETPDSLLTIIDVEVSGENFVVTQNDRQMSGDVTENIYSRAEYDFADSVITLEEGLTLQVYSLVKENLEESIELFAYIMEPINVSGDIENEIIESGDEEKIIEISE